MKANLARREPEIVDFWEKINLYQKVQELSEGKPRFILHDGPPYANGDIHVGHTLNKVLKDIIVKYKSMRGFDAPFVPGWDTHGQPIEHNVLKSLGSKRKGISDIQLRKLCHDYAMKFFKRQRDEFIRLGVRGDWKKPYLTLEPVYEATNIKVFGSLFNKGLIYKGQKPIHWCYNCGTALAEAEIEYSEERSPSIYIKFKVKDDKGKFKGSLGTVPIQSVGDSPAEKQEDVYFMVWTTTPWTLPANVALALDPDGRYWLVESKDEYFVILEDLAEEIFKELSRPYKLIKEYLGKELEGIFVEHPLFDKESVVVLADFISHEQGTGVVHIAPGHGQEDYLVGVKYKLPMPMPVDDSGVFTYEAERFEGQNIYEGNKSITEDLEKRGLLLKFEFVDHSYPHCWRCRKPVIFRATEQWFISMSGKSRESGVLPAGRHGGSREKNRTLREEALSEVRKVNWIPKWSQSRIEAMVSERPDWCVSRQRVWGVPLPVFICSKCDEVLVSTDIIKAVEQLFAKEGADSWYKKEASEIIPSGIKCSKCKESKIEKGSNILDVWFESGVSHEAVLKTRPDLNWPADLYLEGSDQHRGWFQSSLLASVGHQKKAPYKAVLTHGFVVDEQGRKMSKSLGNVVDPLEVIKQSGADILRLWVASSDYTTDVAISPQILKRVSEAYRRIRNTLRFLLANLYDFSKDKALDYSELREIDRWALGRLQMLIKKVTNAYEGYKFHAAYYSIHNFSVVELSAFYLDILKDTLYTESPSSKRRLSAQTVLYELLSVITRLMVPILAFTSEEVWQHLPFGKKYESVQFAPWPKPDAKLYDKNLDEKFSSIQEFRDEVLKALEEARAANLIGNPLEAKVTIKAPPQLIKFLEENKEELPELLIVSEVRISNEKGSLTFVSEKIKGLQVMVEKTKYIKCERCWRYVPKLTEEEELPKLCERCAEAVGVRNER